MGDIYQIEWVDSLKDRIKGPILEIGSKRYGPPPKFFNYRTLFPGIDFFGTDLEPGEGVDTVVDMTLDFNRIDDLMNRKRFNTVICMSVMEHVRDIYAFATNVNKLMNEEAVILLSVPFAWGIHSYPDDYWRFTPSAVKFLFPSIEFDESLCFMHSAEGAKVSITDAKGDYTKWMFVQPKRSAQFWDFLNRRHKPPKQIINAVIFDMFGLKDKIDIS